MRGADFEHPVAYNGQSDLVGKWAQRIHWRVFDRQDRDALFDSVVDVLRHSDGDAA